MLNTQSVKILSQSSSKSCITERTEPSSWLVESAQDLGLGTG